MITSLATPFDPTNKPHLHTSDIACHRTEGLKSTFFGQYVDLQGSVRRSLSTPVTLASTCVFVHNTAVSTHTKLSPGVCVVSDARAEVGSASTEVALPEVEGIDDDDFFGQFADLSLGDEGSEDVESGGISYAPDHTSIVVESECTGSTRAIALTSFRLRNCAVASDDLTSLIEDSPSKLVLSSHEPLRSQVAPTPVLASTATDVPIFALPATALPIVIADETIPVMDDDDDTPLQRPRSRRLKRFIQSVFEANDHDKDVVSTIKSKPVVQDHRRVKIRFHDQ